jgi:hypothetical protein
MILIMIYGGGCWNKKVYIPPENEVGSKIILINTIYDPGFYVELDKKEVGFLKDSLEIRVKPGKHKLKIFNTETIFSDKEETILHKFDLKVELGEGEVKKFILSWGDENYSREIQRGIKRRREEREKEMRGRRREPLPRMSQPAL